MQRIVKEAIHGFFVSLEVSSGFYIYTDRQKRDLIQDINNFYRLGEVTETERQAIFLWLNSIRLGDLGDYSASYYYNVNDRRMRVLRRILDLQGY